MRTKLVLAAIAASLFSTGCGACAEMATEQALKSAGVEVDVDGQTVKIKGKDGEEIEFAGEGDSGTVTVKGKDGELKINGDGTGKLPDGFPLTVADGAKVQGSAALNNDTERTFMASLLNDGEVEKLASFYQRELESKGLKVERTDLDMNGEKFVTLAGKAAGREVSVAISSTEDQGIATQISYREQK